MSYLLRCPTHVYEIVPDAFAPADEVPLQGITKRMEHIAALGVDGIALTPLFPSSDRLRVHAVSFDEIDPTLGTEADFSALCEAAAAHEISVTLTAVFDHVSAEHPWFKWAQQQTDGGARFPPEQRTRDFFSFGDDHGHGYATRENSAQAPELDLSNAEVRRRLITGEESVLHRWMRSGASGWRILRGDQVGYSILRELQRGSRTVEGSHYLVGDIMGFADRALRDGLLDAVVNHYGREGVIGFLADEVPARQLARIQRDLQDGYGKALSRSWLVLSDFERARLPSLVPDAARVRLATLLGYTLPGAAHILYGEEVGIARSHALPGATAMVWDEAQWDRPTLQLHKTLGALRRERNALRVGDFIDLTPEGEWEVFAFARATADPRETVIVIVNRAERPLSRRLFAPLADLPHGLVLKDVFTAERVHVRSGTINCTIQPQDALVLVPDDDDVASARFFRGY